MSKYDKIRYGSLVKRKKSSVVWEVWVKDDKSIGLMNYSSRRPNSRIVTKENFNKYWEMCER